MHRNAVDRIGPRIVRDSLVPARLAALVCCMLAVPLALASVPFYPGPALDPSVFDGYHSPELPICPGATAGNGYGVGTVQHAVNGTTIGKHGLRWGPGGFIELGGLGYSTEGQYNSYVYATNAAGTIVGNGTKYGGSGENLGNRPVRWDAGSTSAIELQSLGTDTGGMSFGSAVAISGSGMIAGHVAKYLPDGTAVGWRAVRWAAGSTAATELGNIGTDSGGSVYNYANAINNAGAIVGRGGKYDAGGQFYGFRAIRWDAGAAAATELGNLGVAADGSATGEACDINSTGTAVGQVDRYDAGVSRGPRAVRWDAGSTSAVELANLGANASGTSSAKAWAINEQGTIAGESTKYDASGTYLGTRAVRWDAGGTELTELEQLVYDANGKAGSYAYDINANDIIVGKAYEYNSPGHPSTWYRAVIWNADGSIVNLNSLLEPDSGWVLNQAVAISDTNWVTGLGTFDPDGSGPLYSYKRLFLMQVPEPCSLGLLGVLGLLLGRRGGPLGCR